MSALFLGHAAVATVKSWIVVPGLPVLILAMVSAGGTGFVLAKGGGGRLLREKKKKMRIIGINGLLIMVASVKLEAKFTSTDMMSPKNSAVVATKTIGTTHFQLCFHPLWVAFRSVCASDPAFCAGTEPPPFHCHRSKWIGRNGVGGIRYSDPFRSILCASPSIDTSSSR
ncbi:MAG: hypothetical protein LBL59_12280 [Xanthomonadaceae bacterium]|nr:hypothetical protein [Xanthomonadaceae bacterium]